MMSSRPNADESQVNSDVIIFFFFFCFVLFIRVLQPFQVYFTYIELIVLKGGRKPEKKTPDHP